MDEKVTRGKSKDRGKGIDKMEKEGKRVGLSIGGGVGEKGNVGRVRNKIMKG